MATPVLDLRTVDLDKAYKTTLIQLCGLHGVSSNGLKSQLVIRLRALRAILTAPVPCDVRCHSRPAKNNGVYRHRSCRSLSGSGGPAAHGRTDFHAVPRGETRPSGPTRSHADTRPVRRRISAPNFIRRHGPSLLFTASILSLNSTPTPDHHPGSSFRFHNDPATPGCSSGYSAGLLRGLALTQLPPPPPP